MKKKVEGFGGGGARQVLVGEVGAVDRLAARAVRGGLAFEAQRLLYHSA